MGNIVNALSKFGNAFSGLGSTLMVPIIIMVVAMVFRVEWKKALKSGLLVGAGFQGISPVSYTHLDVYKRQPGGGWSDPASSCH